MSDSAQQNNPSPDSPGGNGEEIQPFVITMPDDPSSGADWYLWAAVLALIALVAFWPAINGGFLWDDDQYVTHNPALVDASGLKQIWQIPPGTIQYYPLTFTLFWIEHHIWANNALGYRVVNLLLHAGAAIILWRILRRLKIPGAWAAAAIWAVHPLQAESVCWISECKNVLSGVLALGCVFFYLEFAGVYEPSINRRTWNLTADWQAYLLSAGLFILALFAKTAVVFVPVAILLILLWKKRLTMARVLGLVPLLAIGLALGFETSHLETDPTGAIRATGPEWQLTLVQRLLISGRDFWFYIAKLVLPIHQSFIYPRIVPSSSDAIQWLLLAAAAVVLVATLVKISSCGISTAVWCYFLLIFPALGFFDVYPFRYSFVADHFQYLAGIPLIVLAVSFAASILRPLWKSGETAKSSPAVAVLVSILLIVLGATAWIRADVFSDSSQLWEDVLQPDKTPASWLADYNLARNRQGDAKANFDEADRLSQGGDPDSAKEAGDDAMTSLDESDQLLKSAVANSATPDDIRYKAYDLAAQNDVTRLRSPAADSAAILKDASDQIKLAMAYPAAAADPLPLYTLGIVDRNLAQAMQKKAGPTTQTTETTATTRPNTREEQAFIDEFLAARDAFRKAAELAAAGADSPVVAPEAAQVRPRAVLESGDIDWQLAELAHEHSDVRSEALFSRDAAQDYARAVSLDPSNVKLRYQFALALENVHALPEAKEQLMVILRDLDHFNAPAYNEIGRIILEMGPTTMDDFNAAVESFKAALKLNPNLAGAQKNLALAMKMLATSRPATQTTTGPDTQP
jgi:hypothetical protein